MTNEEKWLLMQIFKLEERGERECDRIFDDIKRMYPDFKMYYVWSDNCFEMWDFISEEEAMEFAEKLYKEDKKKYCSLFVDETDFNRKDRQIAVFYEDGIVYGEEE